MDDPLIGIPRHHVGAVVTYLDMRRPPERFEVVPSPLRLEERVRLDANRYRSIFRRVGSPWLWFSRLRLSDADLLAQIGEIHLVRDERAEEAGLIELGFEEEGHCLIRFLGLVPELAGRGHGRWLFANLLRLAWREGIETVRVHTCTLDHPAALRAYLRAGFVARQRAFEHFPDPRLTGILERDCAPHIPLIES